MVINLNQCREICTDFKFYIIYYPKILKRQQVYNNLFQHLRYAVIKPEIFKIIKHETIFQTSDAAFGHADSAFNAFGSRC